MKTFQNVYADESFGPSKANHSSVASVEFKEQSFCFAQVLLLFYYSTQQNEKMSEEFAFVKFFDLTFSADSIYHILNFLRLRWVTDDEIDHTAGRNLGDSNTIEVVEWYEVVPFSSIQYLHHIVKST